MPEPNLAGLTVAVDVQHAYRTGPHARDRGALFHTPNRTKVYEADCAHLYALALGETLASWGATVISNDPMAGILVGAYGTRQAQAAARGALCYLACHMNAGGGSYARVDIVAPLSRPLAADILAALDEAIPEIKSVNLTTLEPTQHGAVCVRGFTRGPAVLLEPLFGDHPAHQRLLSFEGLALVGRAVARGVAMWWPRRPA
jgi:N-acetylmuramoyl-L-alanine amidase